MTTANSENRYKKSCDVWFHLHQAEQLIINDKDYHKSLSTMLDACMDIVETLQHDIEVSGK
jgi:hypothetical protein